ncbi:MAG: ASKHA domain-containing protein [bacterium]
MTTKEVKVLFEPSGRTVHALPGTILLETAARAGFIIHTPCGGAGKCGKCVVRIRHGKCPPSAEEISVLGEIRVAEGCRLACLAKVTGPLTIEIPDTSLFQAQQQILITDAGGHMDVTPRVIKKYIQLQPPGQHDDGSDMERLRTVIGSCQVALSALQTLPDALRSSNFKVTTVQVDDELIAIEPGDTAAACYGLAFDIGTTTLVGTLVNLTTGEDVAVEARVNPQTSFGDDVVSRIQKCRTDPGGLAQLHAAVIEGVNKIIDDLARKTRISPDNIYEVVFAGNTTMQEILCGINPSALGEMPFMPAFREALEGETSLLRLRVHPRAKFYIFPQIGGFVGGDTTAGILATRLDQTTAPTLLVDIGTNGEIVLAHDGKMLATSVAAGPAFEGARIANGMRATSGAIEKIILDGDVRLNVIGNTKPAGLCGSALIDVAAELLRVGILDFTGRILTPAEVPASLPAPLRARLIEENSETHFLLASAAESATGAPLLLYQRDIRELQLANAAIRAGVNILLKIAGLQPEQLETILLAGGFGNFIRRNHARRIGMLPPIACSKIRFVGNTASFGAKRALLSSNEKLTAAKLINRVRHVDLSLDPEFQTEFGNAMLMPEGEFEEREWAVGSRQ